MLSSLGKFIGRFLIAIIFLAAGVEKFFDYGNTAAYMEAAGLPLVPVLLIGAAILEVVAGTALLIGYRTQLAALVLLVFLAVVTFLFHNFWDFTDGERAAQMQNFLKNVAIIGGLVYIFSSEEGSH